MMIPEEEPAISDALKDIDPTDMSVYYAMGEYYPPNAVDTLNIDWQGGRVEIIAYNGVDYFVEEASTRQLMEDERLSYKWEDESFSVTFTADEETVIDDAYKKIEIRVPREKAESLKEININTNGEVVLKNITADKLTVNGKDGNIVCSNTYSDNTEITTTDGNVDLSVRNEIGYSLDFSSKKGKLKSYIDNGLNSYISGDGAYSFKIKTKQGNLNVSLFEEAAEKTEAS